MAANAEPTAVRPDISTRLALERTVLAYERTMLAWVRTATSLITFGFSIQQFFRIARSGAPESGHLIGPSEFGEAMIVIGLLSLLLATLEHRSAVKALKVRYPSGPDQYPDIPRSRARLLAASIAILGLLALASMWVRA
jgi:putative membrane protein